MNVWVDAVVVQYHKSDNYNHFFVSKDVSSRIIIPPWLRILTLRRILLPNREVEYRVSNTLMRCGSVIVRDILLYGYVNILMNGCTCVYEQLQCTN